MIRFIASLGLPFAKSCTSPELVQYLKERQIYVNGPIAVEEEA